jgi:hypothetical protein
LLPLHRLVSLLLFERLGGGGHVTEALTWVLPPIEHRGQGVARIDGNIVIRIPRDNGKLVETGLFSVLHVRYA